ncbi:MAG TPA: ABC transporter substrate-binding protein [Casimicrobiaceae bacterium]|nr:ABC transporter substrate-binding protein [Casimicrobiaceae bacterium]
MRNRFTSGLGLAMLLIFGFASLARAEVNEVKIATQYGIGYLALTVMKQDKLIEKHLAKAGLADTKVSWVKLGAGAAANDALLSGSLDFASGGTGPAFILWDKTRSNVDVRGVAALTSMPNLLVSRNPNVKTIRDFTDQDKIAMAGAGSSVQTIYLEMAAAKEWGPAEYRKLNSLMINLAHPDGLQALLSGAGDVNAQFTSPPFQNYALEKPGIHVVLNSYDVMGGPNTFLMVWATNKFRMANPKTYRAVLDALKEATDSINADKKRAAEMYVKEGGSTEQVDKILKLMEDPQVSYTLAPERVLPFAQFMQEVGVIKNRPSSWKDLFFPEIHDLPGS